MSGEDSGKPHRLPIEGTLDLHTFRPVEAVAVLEAFIEESYERGWKEIRIVHGKGTGRLRELVQEHLRKSKQVDTFRLGDETSGGWGATWAILKQKK